LIIKQFTVSLTILLNCCMVYFPQAVDIPLIEEKDDFRLATGMSIAGVHGTVSYGLTDMIAVQAFGNINILTGFHIQGAVGLYKWFDESFTGMELYGGYGYGGSLFDMQADRKIGNYHLPFIQFNIGREVGVANTSIDLGMGLKGGYLFGNFTGSDLNIHKRNGFIIEPTFLFRFETRRGAMYSIKFNYALPVNFNRKDIMFHSFNFSVGRHFWL